MLMKPGMAIFALISLAALAACSAEPEAPRNEAEAVEEVRDAPAAEAAEPSTQVIANVLEMEAERVEEHEAEVNMGDVDAQVQDLMNQADAAEREAAGAPR